MTSWTWPSPAIRCQRLCVVACGHHLIFRREFNLAAEELELAVDLEPTYWMAQIYLSATYGFQGMFDKAGAILDKLLEAAPGEAPW